MNNVNVGGKVSSHIDLYKATIAKLEAEGHICSAWNVKGTGDVNILFGVSLDSEWMVEIVSKNSILVY
jgi:hypothetical protein